MMLFKPVVIITLSSLDGNLSQGLLWVSIQGRPGSLARCVQGYASLCWVRIQPQGNLPFAPTYLSFLRGDNNSLYAVLPGVGEEMKKSQKDCSGSY